MGLGTRGGGLGVARWLVDQGAQVTITDLRTREELTSSIEALGDLDVRLGLGGHDERDFTPAGADMVIRNPGVRLTSKYLQIARESGVPIEMEMSLFLRHCPAPVIGVTGTKGKTTTSLLIGEILRAWNPATVVAGNMGITALGQLGAITPSTPVVLELSSWQVEAIKEHKLAPHIAVVTNISPDHLDAYDSFEEYAATKRSLVHHVSPDGFAVLNQDDPETRMAGVETIACIARFGQGLGSGNGAWIDVGEAMKPRSICRVTPPSTAPISHRTPPPPWPPRCSMGPRLKRSRRGCAPSRARRTARNGSRRLTACSTSTTARRLLRRRRFPL